jgi:hypothetical protein
MDTFMGEAIILEAALISVLLALWLTWLLMQGLFRLMPATAQANANRPVRPIRLVANEQRTNERRNAA